MSLQWIKLYIELYDDDKVAPLSDTAFRRFVECLLLAGETGEGGYLPPLKKMAWKLRLDPAELQVDLEFLAYNDLLELRDDGDGPRWFVTKFNTRQAHVSNAERQRQWRERNKNNGSPSSNGNHGNVRITNDVTTRYANSNDGSNAALPRIDIDKEIEEDKEGEGSGAIAPAHPPATSPHFQDVPEANKRRKKIDNLLAPSSLPAMVAEAPLAMTLMKDITGYWPGENNREFLIEKLGNQPDEVALRQAVKLWNAAGNKQTNFAGICDWYQELLRDPAWTPQARYKNGNGNGRAAPPKSVSTPAPGSQPVTW